MGWAGLRLLPCPLELTISRILLYCRTSHSFDFSPAVKSGSDPSYHFPLPTFLRSDRENCLLVSDPRRKRRQTDRPDIVPDTSLSLSLSRARAHSVFYKSLATKHATGRRWGGTGGWRHAMMPKKNGEVAVATAVVRSLARMVPLHLIARVLDDRVSKEGRARRRRR